VHQYYRVVAARPEKLRVLTVIDTPAVTGGAEKVAADLAMNIDSNRYESSFCALRPRGRQQWRTTELERAGVVLHRIEAGSMKDVRALRRFVSLLRRGDYDVVHAHLWDAHVWSALATLRSPAAVLIAHEHAWEFEGRRARQILDRLLVARRADAFVTVSHANREKMVALGLPVKKIRHIPNGIDWSGDDADGASVRAEFGIPVDAPVVGVIAVMRPEKRLDVLVEGIAILRRSVPDVRLLIAGGSALNGHLADLRRLVEDRALAEHVHFLGIRTDIPRILDAVDVACLSSDREGMPIALMEYMAAGKPIVSTSVGGVPEMVDDQVEALLVPPRDPSALADGLATLIADPSLATGLGRRAQERQRRQFSLRSFVGGIERLYEELWRDA
jgi:glycosyltransferase involved in cell wall biosynthesis